MPSPPDGSVGASIAANRFPPSFDNNPWSYGYALFGLTLVSVLALAILLQWIFESRDRRRIDRELGNPVVNPSRRWLTPFRVYRWALGFLLATVFIGAFPDVLIMLAWGETDDQTMELLFLFDRLGDGTVLWPVVATSLLLACYGQVIEHKLEIEARSEPARVRAEAPLRARVSWKAAFKQVRLVLLVLMLAAGVTLGKSLA